MNSSRTTLTALAATGVAMAANTVVFGTQVFFDSRPFSEIAATAHHRAFYVLFFACLAALTVLLPRLSGVTGRSGRSIPAAVAALGGLAAYLNGSTQFVQAFVTPDLAVQAPAMLDDSVAGPLMYAMVGSWILWSVALAAVAVAGLARGTFSRPASVLLLVGALVVPVVGPLSGVLVGGALAWAALSAREPAAFQAETSPAFAS